MDSENIDLNQITGDLLSMMRVLMQDVIECSNQLSASRGTEREQICARTYTRAVFAAIEGACETFKHQALVAEYNKVAKRLSFQPGKLSVLGGESFSINESGEIRAQPFRSSFLSNMLFSLKSYQEAQEVTHRTCKGDRWQKVKNGLDVRDKITHPKNAKGLEISEAELDDVHFAFAWFWSEVIAVFKEKGIKFDWLETPDTTESS